MRTSLGGHALACAILLAGCAPVDPITTREPDYPQHKALPYLEDNGRYSELRAETERRIALGGEQTATLLAYNCIAYSRLKQYAKLFECLDRLDKRIATGDTRFKSNIGNIETRYARSASAKPLPGMLRAEALMRSEE